MKGQLQYKIIGLNINKINQAMAFCFSILFFGSLYFFKLNLLEFSIFISALLGINCVWYLFADIKINETHFVIEKFLYKRQLPKSDFIAIRRSFFFYICIIEFSSRKFFFLAEANSIFDANYADKLNSEIKNLL